MRKVLVIGVSLVLLTAGSALAAKPDNPGGDKFDAEAAIQAETDARIDADADLQSQIDNINANIAPHASVMYLRDYYEPPQDCPESWTEANYTGVHAGGGDNLTRTCYNMTNSCTVMYLKEADFILPPNCPDFWSDAGVNEYIVGGAINTARTCYYCAQ